MHSDSLVAKAVEEGLAPCLPNEWVKSVFLNRVFNLGVHDFAVDFALVKEATVLKAEGGPVGDCDIVLIIANLEKNLFIFKGVT
jgi:hypothetical protein